MKSKNFKSLIRILCNEILADMPKQDDYYFNGTDDPKHIIAIAQQIVIILDKNREETFYPRLMTRAEQVKEQA